MDTVETSEGDEGEATEDPRIGQRVAGDQYRVLGRLGAGGFGVVYEVETAVGGLRRALKVLAARWITDERIRKGFVREAQVLEQVNHPNVARCYAAGHLGDDGELYLLLELIRGEGLRSLLTDSDGAMKPLEPRRAVRLAKQIASALDAAHRAGVLHRDLKPDNVLVVAAGTPAEQVKVVDFGIAKILDEGVASTGTVAGTPQYMAPEQFEPGVQLDARVDLYALGAVLFTLLTGRPPIEGSSVGAVIAQLGKGRELGPRPSEKRPELADHPALDLFVARLLAGDPKQRPASAIDVVDELARLEHGLNRDSGQGGAHGLLGALCATPSESAWLALQGYLGTQSDDETLVRDAERLLDGWPSELRRATCALWESSKRGTPHRLWPIVRSLDLSARCIDDAELERIAENPALAWVTELDLSHNEITNAGLRAFARSPHIAALRSLRLCGNRISSGGLERLVGEGACPQLTHLSLGRNGIGTRGAEALAKGALALTSLDLSDNDLGPEAAAALAGSEALGRLTTLALGGNRLGPDGAAALAVSSSLRSLECLDLTRNSIGPSGAAALALSEALRGVRRLVLAGNALGREGLKLLLSARTFERLEELDLAGNDLGPAGAMVLAGAPSVRRLWRLRLANDGLGDAGVAALLGSANLSGLRTLDIAQNDLSASAVSLIGDAPPQLEHLDLSRNPLGAAGATSLAESLRRLRIRHLAVSGCNLDGRALAELLHAATRLESLDAADNPIGTDGARLIAQVATTAQLEHLDLSRCGLGRAGLASLLDGVGSLRRLALSSNRLGDEGASLLVAYAPRLPRLERLELDDDDLGPEAAAALAASAFARHLGSLSLAHNPLRDAGAEALGAGAGWHALTSLCLSHCEIGSAGVASLANAASLGFVQHLDLSHNILAGGADMHSLAEHHVALMEESFGRVAAQGSDFAERFYEELFARYPAVAPLFAQTDMAKQQRHLLQSLVLTIDSLRNPELVEKNLRALGQRHQGYGVVPTHYFAVTSTLLDVLREISGDGWTPELEAAWSEGLRAVSETMMAIGHATGPTRDALGRSA